MNFVVIHGHQVQYHILVGRVAGHARVIGEKDHPFPVRRNVRKPVVGLIRQNLFLLASVRLHAPDLHPPRALGVEIDELAVRRIFGAVIQSRCGGEADFLPAGYRNRIDIEVAVALPRKRDRLSIRRPSMPVRRRVLGNLPRRSASERRDKDGREMVRAGLIAERDRLAIRRDAVIVIAMILRGKSGLRRAPSRPAAIGRSSRPH